MEKKTLKVDALLKIYNNNDEIEKHIKELYKFTEDDLKDKNIFLLAMDKGTSLDTFVQLRDQYSLKNIEKYFKYEYQLTVEDFDNRGMYHIMSSLMYKKEVSIFRFLGHKVKLLQASELNHLLIKAARYDYHHFVEVLVKDLEVDPNFSLRYGGTALSIAIHEKHINVVRELLNNGADSHRNQDNYLSTSIIEHLIFMMTLSITTEKDRNIYIEIFELIVSYETDLHLENNYMRVIVNRLPSVFYQDLIKKLEYCIFRCSGFYIKG